VLAFTPAEFRFARGCFWLAAALILGGHFMWQWTTDQPLGMKVLAGAVVGAFVVGGLRWVGMDQPEEGNHSLGPTFKIEFPEEANDPQAGFPFSSYGRVVNLGVAGGLLDNFCFASRILLQDRQSKGATAKKNGSVSNLDFISERAHDRCKGRIAVCCGRHFGLKSRQ